MKKYVFIHENEEDSIKTSLEKTFETDRPSEVLFSFIQFLKGIFREEVVDNDVKRVFETFRIENKKE